MSEGSKQPNVVDGSTELNSGSGGSVMDEDIITRDDGTIVHRTRVHVGDGTGKVYGDNYPMPVMDQYMRQDAERSEILARYNAASSYKTRDRERMFIGDRMHIFGERCSGRR